MSNTRGLKPFTSGAWREFVQNRLEAVGIAPNRVSLLMGAQPRGRDAHYRNPAPEELAKEYMKAANDLIVYEQFMGKPMSQTQISAEQIRAIIDQVLSQVVSKVGVSVSLAMVREQFRQAIAQGLEDKSYAKH